MVPIPIGLKPPRRGLDGPRPRRTGPQEGCGHLPGRRAMRARHPGRIPDGRVGRLDGRLGPGRLDRRLSPGAAAPRFAASGHPERGLPVSAYWPARHRRDPASRRRVLESYEYRCAVCGLDVRLGSSSIALDAAEIRRHQAGGPETESNGLAPCVEHHQTFDLGVFTLADGVRLDSDQSNGTTGFQEAWMASLGKTDPGGPASRMAARAEAPGLDRPDRRPQSVPAPIEPGPASPARKMGLPPAMRRYCRASCWCFSARRCARGRRRAIRRCNSAR